MKLKSVIAPVILLAVSHTAQADVLKWAEGFWGLDETRWDAEDYKERNCTDSPVEIRIDRESMTYWSKIGDNQPRTAIITDVTDKGFTLKYENETRLMDDGNLQVWTISFADRNKFHWIREDWKVLGPQHKTAPRYRCMLEMA